MPSSPDSPVSRAELKAELKAELGTLEERVLERIEKVETNLLRELGRWTTK